MADKGKEKAPRETLIWVNVRKCFGCKSEFLPAVPPDGQYVLVRVEADWHEINKALMVPTVENRIGRQARVLNTSFQHSTPSIYPFCCKKCSPAFETWQVAVLVASIKLQLIS